MAIITVPRVLREKLGEDGADALVSLINEANNQAKGDVLTFVEEKFERRLSEEIAKVNERITTEVAKLQDTITREIAKVNERITGVEARLDVGTARLKAELIRWMFIFWIGQVGVVLGIPFAFFRR
jgi:gas vesicle protein